MNGNNSSLCSPVETKRQSLDLVFKDRVQEPSRHQLLRRSSDTTCKAGELRGGPIAL